MFMNIDMKLNEMKWNIYLSSVRLQMQVIVRQHTV
jgi:hypothetical protein